MGITVAVIWLVTIVIGLVKPIGVFGFLAALLVTGVVAAVLIARGGREAISPPAPSTDLPNAAMVDRFDSYIYRVRGALPAPAQAELDKSPGSCRRSNRRWGGSRRSIRRRRTRVA